MSENILTVEVVPHNGHIICRQYGIKQVYIGYTKRQAVREFQQLIYTKRLQGVI